VSPSSSDLIGQLLAIRLEVSHWSGSLERFLKRYQPAGILLSMPRWQSPEAAAELSGRLAGALSTPPFLRPGDERTIDRLASPLPSPRAAADAGLSAVERLAGLVGRGFQLLGFNSYGGPTLDLVAPGAGSPFVDRAFSADPQIVARCGDAFIRELEHHRIVACPGSFPGLGNASGSRHDPPLVIDKPMAALWREDLVPYRELLSRMALVRVSPAAYKAFDYDLPKPAPLSERVVEGLLRVRMGYRGAAVADLNAVGVAGQKLSVGQAAVRAVNSGCDLLVVRGEGELAEAFAALQEGVQSGALPPERLEGAVSRTRGAKKGLALPSGTISVPDWDQLLHECKQFGEELRTQE
jgi:beta-N-acetylhexosaminidase